MHKFKNEVLSLFIFLTLLGCEKNTVIEDIDAMKKTQNPKLEIEKQSTAQLSIQDGSYCFIKNYNQDVTNVKLVFAGDAISGVMNWVPYQKDSARGTLKGTKNQSDEFDLIYDYMIEGNQQTETKRMKMENGKLLIKIGELLDPNDSGNLVYKNVNQAKFSEVLEPVACN